MNAADRTGPQADTLDDAVLNTAAMYPFETTPQNGYRELTLENVGDALRLVHSIPDHLKYENDTIYGSGVVCWINSIGYLQIIDGFGVFPGWAGQTLGNPYGFDTSKLIPGARYTYEMAISDVNTLTVSLWRNGGVDAPWSPDAAHAEVLGVGTLTLATAFTPPVTFCFGWPDSTIINVGSTPRGIYGATIHSAEILLGN